MSHHHAKPSDFSPCPSPPPHPLALPPSPSASARSRSSLDASAYDVLSEEDCGDDVSSTDNPSLHESVFGELDLEPHADGADAVDAATHPWEVVDGTGGLRPRELLLGGESWSDADFHSSTLGSGPDPHGLEPSAFLSRPRRVENPFVEEGSGLQASAYSSSMGTVNHSLAHLPEQPGLVFPRASPEGSYSADAPRDILFADTLARTAHSDRKLGDTGLRALNSIPTLGLQPHRSTARPAVQAWVAEHTRFLQGSRGATVHEPAPVDDKEEMIQRPLGRRLLPFVNTVKLVSKQVSLPAGVLALAFLASALLSQVGNPVSPFLTRPKVTVDVAVVSAITGWASAGASSATSAIVGISTQVGPDMQLIKHALAQATAHSAVIVPDPPAVTVAKPAEPLSPPTDVIVLPKYMLDASARGRSLSIRKDVVAVVATPPSALALVEHSWRSVKRRARHLASTSRSSGSSLNASNAAAPQHEVSDCDCTLTKHAQRVLRHRMQVAHTNALAVVARTELVLRDAQDMALGYAHYIYGATMAELSRELQELQVLFNSVLETSSTVSTFLLQRSFKGLRVARSGAERVAQRVRMMLPAASTAEETMRKGAEHIEDDAASRLAAVVEEATEYLDETFRRAKGGLDNIVAKARRGTPAPPEVHDDPGPTKWLHAGYGEYRLRGMRTRHRRDGRTSESTRDWTPPKMERPDRAQRLMDAVHHGAMAFVFH